MTMQFEEALVGQSKEFPAKVVIYGVPKIGKSRFASNAEDVFFINIEGGLQYLDHKVRSTPKLNTYDEVIGWLKHIYEDEKFTCGTLALDSLDWLEKLAKEKLVKAHSATSITDPKHFGFGKGNEMVGEEVQKIFKWLDAINKKKQIKSIVIAHSEIKTIDTPDGDAYSRFQLKLTKEALARTQEWADLILFANYKFAVNSDGKAVGEQRPVLCAGGTAAHVSGGRMRLNKELPLDYKQLYEHLTKEGK